MSVKSCYNRPPATSSLSNTVDISSPYNESLLAKVTNDFEDDLLTGRMNGRGTGFTGGYTSNISQTPTQVMPTYSGWNGWVPLPDPVTGTGANLVQMASSSTQDSSGGTGVYAYLLIYMDLNLVVKNQIVYLNGTTPVTLGDRPMYHFLYAFPFLRGSTYPSTTGVVQSNIGQIWLGYGTFSTTTGFSTANYMWNRVGDGFLSSSVYVVPKDKFGSLWSVKLNSDTSVACSFKTYSRASRTSPWSLNAEDNVTTGIVIRRSLAGGFSGQGSEFTVVANKTQATNNIAANFVMCCYEFSARSFQQGNPDF